MNKIYLIAVVFLIPCSLAVSLVDVPTNPQELVHKWESLISGKPVNCVPFQYLFTGDGVVETSNGTTRGIQRIYSWCENNLQKYQQFEAFVTSPLYINGKSVAFERTFLLVTEFNCRLSWHGISTFELNDDFSKIRKWTDFYDKDDLNKKLKECDLFSFTDETEQETVNTEKESVSQ